MEGIILGILLWLGALWQEVLSVLPAPAEAPPPPAEAATSTATFPESATVEEEKPAASEPGPLVASSSAQPMNEPEEEVEYPADFVTLLEGEIHKQINSERKQQDLKNLFYNKELADIARAHSKDMAQNNYFDHKDAEGCDSACRVTAAGYEWRRVGENIFLIQSSIEFSVGDLATVIVQGWMGSPGHRRNILESGFSHEGLGVFIEGKSVYATELFSKPR